MVNPPASVIARNKFPAIVLSALTASATQGIAAPPTYDDLTQRIRELESKVTTIESQQSSRADQEATLKSVLDDASRRGQLPATSGALNAGYDNGFFIQNDDGSFLFKPS